MKRTSILIPIHNRLTITQNGLDLLNNSLAYYYKKGILHLDFQTVVIDDGSTDGSSDWIKQNYPGIHLLTGDGNLWWSGAINLGSEYAINVLKSDYVLLWNDDVIPNEDYFIRLVELINSPDSENKIFGSRIMVHENPSQIWSLGGHFNKFTGKLGMYNTPINDSSSTFECDWQPGMGTLIPTSIISEMDLWWNNKKFPQYHGDADFVLRCKKKGIRVITRLDLVLYNKTEITGITKKKNIKDVYDGLTSIRSNYNFYRYWLFYNVHGIIPIAYFGLLKKYYFYIGGYIKNAIIK